MTAQMSAMRNHVLEIEKQVQKEAKAYVHYNHTEPCNGSRWTAKECFEYMYARPWEEVNNFYSECVSGRSLLQELFGAGQARGLQTHDQYDAGTPLSINKYSHTSGQPDDQHGKWARVTFKIVISYLGKSFDGWQKQPSQVTVQGLVERSIGRFVDDMKAERLKEKGLPVEGMVVVAGRTDKGVTALHQVCSFYTWRKDIKEQEIEDAVNNEAPGKLRVVSVSQVSRTFHPNFCAKWRRYLYIFPLLEKEEGRKTHQNEEERKYHFYVKNQVDNIHEQGEHSAEDTAAEETVRSESELVESSCFSVTRVDQLLRHLEEKLLSYKMFARDTKASRNIGPATECYIHHARAAKASMPCLGGASTMKVMCVELVANRFLRKMVRVLVATAIREAAAGAEDDILLKLMDATCRRATAPPAPPDGLCLFDVGYEDFDRRKCFIG